MLGFRIDRRSNVVPYLQLVEQVHRALRTGLLEPGDQLPTVREVAESAEERAPGVRTITTTSPLGSAVLGARLEDEITYEAPGGAFRYRVVSFEPRS